MWIYIIHVYCCIDAQIIENSSYLYLISEKAMAPHSSTLAWKIPWTEEPGRLQSMWSLRVGHDRATSLSFSLSSTWEGNGNPLQFSCLENPRDGGAWWAAVYGVTQSRTRLKWLSSSGGSKDFPGGPLVKTPSSSAGAQVPSMVGKLRSHMPWGVTKNEIKNKNTSLRGLL